jgi:outer membrane protein assembly factor BamB
MFRGDPACTGVSPSALPETLDVRWRVVFDEPIVSTAAISEGVVYVGCDDEHLYALDLRDGSVRWKYKATSMVQSSPLVLDRTVYVGDDEGVLHAVDTRTGAASWTFKTDARIASSPNHADGRIVFGSYDGFLYCLDMTGKLSWKLETAGYVHAMPAILGDRVLAAGCDEHLYAVRIADGEVLSKTPMGSPSGATPACIGSRAYIGTHGHQVRCVDFEKGETIWAFEDADRPYPFESSFAVTKQAAFIGGRDKRFRAFDPVSGSVRWTFAAQGRIESSAVVVGDRVFFGASDGRLYELDARTGRQRWQFETGSAIGASPAVAEGCLVIGDLDGTIYCLGAKPEAAEPKPSSPSPAAKGEGGSSEPNHPLSHGRGFE